MTTSQSGTQESIKANFTWSTHEEREEQKKADEEAYWKAARELTAEFAMLGILAGRRTHQGYKETASEAIKYADALIKQLREQ